MSSRRNPARQKGRFKGTSLYEQFGKMGISDTIHEGETMSSGIQDFLNGNGPTPKRKSAQDRRTNASSRTTTPRPGSTKPSQSETTAESRSDERTPSRSKSANGSARNTNSSQPRTPKSVSSNTIHQQQLVRPRIVLNGFNLSEDSEANVDDLDGTVIDEFTLRLSKFGRLPKMPDVLVACPKTLQQSQNYTTTTFLLFLTTGTSIITPEWIDDSIDENKFLPVKGYRLMDQDVAGVIDINGSCETHYSLSLAITNGIKAARNGGILAGYYFTMCPGIGDEDDPFTKNPIRKEKSTEEVRLLLTAAGAKEVNVDEDEDSCHDNLLFIMSMKATEEQIQYAANLTNGGGYRVSLTVILETLKKQSLVPLENVLEIRRKKAEEEKKTASTAAFFAPTDAGTEVVFSQSIFGVTRSLSRHDGDETRAHLGELGTLQVVCESGVRTVYYKDQAGDLKFNSPAPSLSPLQAALNFVMFGNSGKQHCVAWEATNVAGKFSSTCDQEVLNRRFFFWFRDRPQLDTFLMALFGNGDPSQSILQEWYDKNGRFYRHEETLPAHDIAAEEHEMDDEDDFAKEALPYQRSVEICEHGKDTYEVSQMF